jgi:anti-sigma factor RsiW
VTHLGDRAAAFVDGQLTPESAERATAHLAGCRPCRDLVELERLTKMRLSALRGPEPTADLVGRLLAMGGPSGPLPPRPGHVPGTPRPEPVSLPEPLRGGVQVLRRAARTETPPPVREVARPRTRRPAPVPTRPAGRPRAARTMGTRPRRLAVAVFGALSVVGVGVAGVAAGSTAAASAPGSLQQRLNTVVEPASAGLLPARLTPIEWTQVSTSGVVPVDRAVARR